jgi:hypothetical protein
MNNYAAALLFVALAGPAALAHARPAQLPAVQQYGRRCSRLTVRSNTVLRVELPSNHGGELAVISPSGEYFFIAFDQPDKTINFIPPIPAAVFERMRSIDLEISSIEGISWSKRTWKAEPIFVKTGEYKLVVSPGLQTEDPEIDGWCLINYLN